jgi:K+-transporting ATPase ATPase C chain
MAEQKNTPNLVHGKAFSMVLLQLRAAVRVFLLLTVLSGVVYPGLVTIIASVCFPNQAGGSLILRSGHPVGSALIGQPFNDPKYFWSRPSATTPPYNAAASGGSNLGPT